MSDLKQNLETTASRVGVRAVYGDPVELDGTTLIPVAASGFGYGGGSGGEGDEANEGGGGGGWSVPLGAYVSTRDGVRFDPNLVALAVVAVPALWVAGRVLVRVIRALKR